MNAKTGATHLLKKWNPSLGQLAFAYLTAVFVHALT